MNATIPCVDQRELPPPIGAIRQVHPSAAAYGPANAAGCAAPPEFCATFTASGRSPVALITDATLPVSAATNNITAAASFILLNHIAITVPFVSIATPVGAATIPPTPTFTAALASTSGTIICSINTSPTTPALTALPPPPSISA